MNAIANTTFKNTSWDEQPYTEIDAGRKLTRVRATFAYSGDLEGEGQVEYLLAYSPDGTGSFVGLEYVSGQIGDRAGRFVVQHTGVFDPTSVTTRWEIVPNLGAHALEGLTGGGSLKLEGHGPYPFTFEYALPK